MRVYRSRKSFMNNKDHDSFYKSQIQGTDGYITQRKKFKCDLVMGQYEGNRDVCEENTHYL